MADKDMPMLLDDGITMPLDGVDDVVGNVDDLFGDTAALSMPQSSKQIDLRIDKLRNRGCCRAVAWSKVGAIASITPNGLELQVRLVRSQPENGEWDLTDPITCDLIKGSTEEPLVHLEWAESNNPELAVFDSLGRITLLIFSNVINQPFVMKKGDDDTVDGTHAIVGCHWLQAVVATGPGAGPGGDKPTKQTYNTLFGPAQKTNQGYQYNSSFVHAEGPSHPQPGRSALLTVTAGGLLKVTWMQANNRPEETRLELESLSNSDELITHAAFASEKKHLILALATTSRQLRFLKIELNWNAQMAKSGHPQQNRYILTLAEKHWATTSCLDDIAEQLSTPEMSHLLTVPSVLSDTASSTLPPMVISVRSRTPNETSFPMAQSIIERWEAVEEKHGLQSALEQLANRRNSISLEVPTTVHMKPLDPVIIDKCVVGIQTSQFGKVIVLMFSDGGVQHRDRDTFQELYTMRETQSVSHLKQLGWMFPEDAQCQEIALSPTQCSMVRLGDNGKLKWVKMFSLDGDFGNSMRDEMYAATVAALTLTAATAIKYQCGFDDMLALIRPFMNKPKFVQDWVAQLMRILSVQVDYVSAEEPHDTLLRNAPLPACLGILIAAGYRGDSHPRTFSSNFSLATCAIRSAAYNLTLAVNTQFSVANRKSLLDDWEVVNMLVTVVEWSLGVFAWITDALFELMNDEEYLERLTQERQPELGPYMEKKNDPALQLVLASSSRAFLLALCRRLTHLEQLGNKAFGFYQHKPADPGSQSGRLRTAYLNLYRASHEGKVKIHDFEELLKVIGKNITHAYEGSLPKLLKVKGNPAQGKEEDEAIKALRTTMETQMILAAPAPLPFLHVLKKIFTKDMPAFRKVCDPALLFFETFSVLNVQEENGGNKEVTSPRTMHLDALTKAKARMDPAKQWRRCTRCTAVMEEAGPRGPGYAFLVNSFRRCMCSGTWALLPSGKVDF